MPSMRTLYFDIDGVLLDYSDRPKKRLCDGRLQAALEAARIDRLVCVSSWTDLVTEALRIHARGRVPTSDAMVTGVHRVVADVFPDEVWFRQRIALAFGNDERGRHIDLAADWFYCDDWADHFVQRAHGAELYERELGRRIHRADPHDDGSGLLGWLDDVTHRTGTEVPA
jgi:hypothetical protein